MQPRSRGANGSAAGAGTTLGADWYVRSVDDTLAELAVSSDVGLSDEEAARRLQEAGPNELVEKGAKSPARILLDQLSSVMVLILLAAAVLSLLLGKYLEAGTILAIVALFAILGFVQEYRAERAIAALRKLSVPNVRVRRSGVLRELPAPDLVPGEIVLLEAGNTIPADLRVIESANLRVQEAALTGESEPVEKETSALDRSDVPLGDRRNMAYLGTQVTYGRGQGVVVATGMRTELGKIAALIQEVKPEPTPLQQRLDAVGKKLALAGVIVAALVFAIGLWGGESVSDMILSAISVAVAVIPEGLPAVVTFTLALGAQRMLKRNALVRKLPAVETLGSVDVICSDKTGTLTENRMTVTVMDVVGHRLELTEEMRLRLPALAAGGAHPEWLQTQPPEILMLLASGALCNDASLQLDPGTGAVTTLGDPTEGALLVAAAQATLQRDHLQAALPRVAEVPFDSDRKRMTTIHRREDMHTGAALKTPFSLAVAGDFPYLAVTKGSVDGLLEISTQVWKDGSLFPLDDGLRSRIETANAELAANGMRVLGFAFRLLAAPDTATAEQGLVFIGLMGLIDPPRPEVRAAVQTSRAAGVRPIMITGDHPLTASFIAKDLGIATNGAVVTGVELNRMTEAELAAAVEETAVFARVSPEHKLRIVDALQGNGHIVAMTGDGVNDAPALKEADIGVAMGITGTDVSKEAAAMILRDDNFATIVAAVEEGRVIYDNLRRFVKFAVAGNIGKMIVMVLWPVPFILFGWPLGATVALLPLQLLWLNLLTDGVLGISMGAEPAERNVMSRPPHNPKSGIFSGGYAWQTAWVGAFIGVVALGVGLWYYLNGLAQWQTMIFNTLAFLQVFQALAIRSDTESLFRIGLFSNRVMVGAVAAVLLFQLVALYAPVVSNVFLQVEPLSVTDFLVSAGLGVLLLGASELEKWFLRRSAVQSQLQAARF